MPRGNFRRDRRDGAVFGRAVKSCPPDRLPLEGETIFARVTVRSISDYVIDEETGLVLAGVVHIAEHKLKLKGKLTWDQAREIRRRCQEDHTLVYHVLATEYGCHATAG